MSTADIVRALESIKRLKLTKLLFSFMDVFIESIEVIDPDILEAFNQLDIEEKEIC